MQQIFENNRGNWEIETIKLLGQGANATVYEAKIKVTNPNSSFNQTQLINMGLPPRLVLRLPDVTDPKDRDKAVEQFDNYTIAWNSLDFNTQKHFMKPIFCERGLNPTKIRVSGSAPRSVMVKGDAIFSLMEGQTVWDLFCTGMIPPFSMWRQQLFDLIEGVCLKGVHYRDWHSENVLLYKEQNSSWEIKVIDPGALIKIDKVIWQTPILPHPPMPRYKFDKYEIGVSIMGIQDLIWIAVRRNQNEFFETMKKILCVPQRQVIMPKIIEK